MNNGRGPYPAQRQIDVSARRVPVGPLVITGTGTGSAQTLHTCASIGLTAIRHMAVRNTTGTAATLTFHAIPSGDSIGDANELIPSLTVPAQTVLQIDGILGEAFAASTAFQVFSGTGSALMIWGTVEQAR